MKVFVLAIFILCSGLIQAQKERVQIKGKVITTSEEPVEAITIFNLNNLEGTITNEQGIFYIYAMLGDQLNFDALQFVPFTLKVSQSTIEKKETTITLNEGINELDEVTISDNMMMIPVQRERPVDIKLDKLDPEKMRVPAINRMENTFSDRVRQPEDYPLEQLAANQSELRYNMFNLVGLLGALVVSEALKNIDLNGEPKKVKEEFDVILLKNKYDTNYLTEFLALDKQYLYEFMYFAKDNGLSKEMFQPEKELELLQFLQEQSIIFKKRKGLIEVEKY